MTKRGRDTGAITSFVAGAAPSPRPFIAAEGRSRNGESDRGRGCGEGQRLTTGDAGLCREDDARRARGRGQPVHLDHRGDGGQAGPGHRWRHTHHAADQRAASLGCRPRHRRHEPPGHRPAHRDRERPPAVPASLAVSRDSRRSRAHATGRGRRHPGDAGGRGRLRHRLPAAGPGARHRAPRRSLRGRRGHRGQYQVLEPQLPDEGRHLVPGPGGLARAEDHSRGAGQAGGHRAQHAAGRRRLPGGAARRGQPGQPLRSLPRHR